MCDLLVCSICRLEWCRDVEAVVLRMSAAGRWR